jgi:hypothetical protein
MKKMEREMRKLKRALQKEEDEKRELVRVIHKLRQKCGMALLARNAERMEANYYKKQTEYWREYCDDCDDDDCDDSDDCDDCDDCDCDDCDDCDNCDEYRQS